MSDPTGAVVVGVDGSKEALTAVDLAVAQAVRHGRPLRVVHGFIWPYMRVPLGPSELGPPEGGLRNQAERLVEEAVEYARAAAPELAVTGELITGSGGEALIKASQTAALVVVGDRGLGAFAGLLLGAVSVHVAAHASCPVLVSRGTVHPELPVLVAVDGSPANDAAIGFAFAEASAQGVPLVALHVWKHPMSTGPGDMQPLVYDPAVVREDEIRVLTDALAGWREQYPDVDLRPRSVQGRIRASIIEATAQAQMVVLGARGHGGFTGMLLGSVSQSVLHHSACPVAIVRPTA